MRPDGWVYVVIENRVWELPPIGDTRPMVSDTAAFAFVSAVAAADSARVCISDYLGRRVHLYQGDKGVTREVRWPWYPTGVAAAPDGGCYVLERRFRYGGISGALNWAADLLGTPRVRRIDADGRAVVVAHGVVCKVLLLCLLPQCTPADWLRLGRVANLSVSELVHDGIGWTASRLLEVPPPVAALTAGAPTGVGEKSQG